MCGQKKRGDYIWMKRAFLLLFLDIISILVSYLAALLLRFDFIFSSIPREYLQGYLWSMPYWTVITVVVFYGFRLYHSIWRFAGLDEAKRIMWSYIVLIFLYAAGIFAMDLRMPRSYFFIGYVFSILMTTGLRFAYRLLRSFTKNLENDGDAAAERVMIIGGGNVSYFLAKMLVASGIAVKIIESSLERCELLSDLLPEATIIHGDGTDRDLLEEEGLSSCEAFVALTGMDEENILLSLHAGQHSRAKLFTKVNRVNFEEVIDSLPIGTIIRTKQTTAELIGQYTRAMQNSMGSNIETLHQLGGGAEALEFRVAAHDLTGVPLQDMPIRPDVLLCCINRKGLILTPRGQNKIKVGDTVIVVTTLRGLHDIRDILKE